jgi:hypothetical protein
VYVPLLATALPEIAGRTGTAVDNIIFDFLKTCGLKLKTDVIPEGPLTVPPLSTDKM